MPAEKKEVAVTLAIRLTALALLSGCAMSQQQADALGNLGAAMLAQPGYTPSYNSPGIYKGERISGFNKMCFYDRLGNTYVVNVPATQLCPIPGP